MQAKQSLLQNRILKNAQHATNTYSTDRLSRTCLYFTYKAEPTQVYEKKKRDRVSTILGVFVHAGLKHLQAANASSSNTRYNLKYRTNIRLNICWHTDKRLCLTFLYGSVVLPNSLIINMETFSHKSSLENISKFIKKLLGSLLRILS
jgi:hypothetical protein